MLRTTPFGRRPRASVPAAAFVLDFETSPISSLVTFTRSSNGTYFDSTGTLQTASSNVARFDYNPLTLVPLGLLVEEQRTNLLLNSLADGTNLSTQGVAVTAQAYTLSFFGTGTVTLSGASTAGPLVGTGATTKVSLTFTPSAGTLTLTVSGTVKWANLEVGSSATSFIPTAGAAATRNADNVVISTISPWFNASEGTVVVEGDVNATTADGTARVLWGFSDGTFNESIYVTRNASAASLSSNVIDGGVNQASLNAGNVTANTAFKSAVAYKVNDFAHSLNGAAVVTDTSGTLPTVTGLTIGNANWAGANGWINGHIRRLSYYNTRLTNAQLQALSTL